MTGLGIDRKVASALAMALFAGSSAAANPLVDRQTSSPVTSLTREDLEGLPTGRRIEDLVKTCPSTTFPTVTRSPQTLVDGQPTSAPFSINCLAPTDVELIEVYRVHNAARAEYGAPPLARDPLLELSAGEYVGQLARTGKSVHAPRAGRGNIRENISQGLPGWSAGQLVGSWVKEKQNFVPGTFPNVSRTGNWYDIGHWAQMIWVKTVMIGCARAAGIGGTWMVCRYGPGGNKDGELVGVPPPRPYLVETPNLPTTEAFVQKKTTVGSDQAIPGSTLSYSDLGIYAGGTSTRDWFAFPEDGAASDDLFSDPQDRLLLTIRLVDHTQLPVSGMADISNLDWEPESAEPRRSSLFDLGIYAGGAWSAGWFELTPDEMSEATVDTKIETPTLPKAEVYTPTSAQWGPATVATSDLKTMIEEWNADVKRYEEAWKQCDKEAIQSARAEIETLGPKLKGIMEATKEAGEFSNFSSAYADLNSAIIDSKLKEVAAAKGWKPPKPTAVSDTEEPTKVQQPGLPTMEVFNPADLPQCSGDVM